MTAYVSASLEAAVSNRIKDFLVETFNVNDPRNPMKVQLSAKDLLDNGARALEGALEDDPILNTRR